MVSVQRSVLPFGSYDSHSFPIISGSNPVNSLYRAYIMRGFLEGTAQRNHQAAVEFMSRALEIIEWGSKEWKNVSIEDRGVIFRPSFIRGLQVMYMEAYMKVF